MMAPSEATNNADANRDVGNNDASSTSPREQADKMSLALWCFLYGAGIIGTLVVYGLLQERIMTIPYGGTLAQGGELFTVSAFLVLCNRICNTGYATSMMYVYSEEPKPKAPLYKYFIISLSNVAATTCQYECLKYVAFPVQMLGKSFKMMPVMIWGIIISGKQFKMVDWIVAACVTLGVTEFCMTGPMSSPNDRENSMYGILLLVGFLACDGLTSTMQEKLFREHNTTKFNQMFYVNSCSSIVSLFSVLSMGKMGYCLAFMGAHSEFVLDAGLLSMSAASAQYFIYSQVKEYGALVFAATMNVRQVVSILMSYATYGHTVTILQIGGLTIIFGALFFKSYVALTSEDKKKEKGAAGEKEPLLGKDPDGVKEKLSA
jgi:adenosine 3'-phospho 5'-phosphosulfate transporter B2